ncbi:MAG: hypothetical protein LBH43_09595 [Treponema sp.]|jgi:L-cystine uptake protein TcyP (sodium:dicarboxylate symporter family)|nr:hypothetical protein [Treponema sp.]
MKKMMVLCLLCIVNVSIVYGQEYTIYYSGDNIGFITIKKESSGKIAIIPKMQEKSSITIDKEVCPLLPEDDNFYLYIDSKTQLITIEGNTTTATHSDGRWNKKVVDKQGKNIFITEESRNNNER